MPQYYAKSNRLCDFQCLHQYLDYMHILNQKEHHRLKSFEEEFVQFLKKHHIDYDERYVWG